LTYVQLATHSTLVNKRM